VKPGTRPSTRAVIPSGGTVPPFAATIRSTYSARQPTTSSEGRVELGPIGEPTRAGARAAAAGVDRSLLSPAKAIAPNKSTQHHDHQGDRCVPPLDVLQPLQQRHARFPRLDPITARAATPGAGDPFE
jgi:hypothetical protein